MIQGNFNFNNMWSAYLVLFFIFGILLLPFIVAFLLLNFFTAGLAQLGFSSLSGFLIVLFMILGSFVNIPVGKKKEVVIEDRRFFGILERKVKLNQGLSINLGGAIIPLFIVAVLLSEVPFLPTLLSTLVVTFICYRSAQFTPSIGIRVPALLPVLGATIMALLFAPQNPEVVAFISGTLGTLIGGDLLHISKVINKSRAVMSIGGAGVFDGIFLVGIVASLLASI